MKSLILAAGKGTRAKFSDGGNKCLYKISPSRAIIDFSLENAALYSSEIIIVVGYRADDIKSHIGSEYNGVPVRYVIQEHQIGVTDAMLTAKQIIGDDDFLLFLGDEILIGGKHKQMIESYKSVKEIGAVAVCGFVNENDKSRICKTYSISSNTDGRVTEIIEKPSIEQIKSNRLGTGICIFGPRFWEYARKIPERSFSDVLQYAVEKGDKVYCFEIGDTFSNINTTEELETIRRILDSSE
jgi:NDP-sugar pyrophosphorylase family protein